MFKTIYLLVLTSFFSCNKTVEIKESSISLTNSLQRSVVLEQDMELDKKEKIVKTFFDLFDEDFVSIRDSENVFGSHLVEEEHLFYQNCEKENNIEHCNEVFDECIDDTSKCRSRVFYEIKKSKLIKDVSFVENRESILNNLKKIDGYNYQISFNGVNYKINFSIDETGRRVIINRFSVNGVSIFESLW